MAEQGLDRYGTAGTVGYLAGHLGISDQLAVVGSTVHLGHDWTGTVGLLAGLAFVGYSWHGLESGYFCCLGTWSVGLFGVMWVTFILGHNGHCCLCFGVL